MYVRAKNSFNHGGIVKMNYGERLEVRDDIAKTLISMDLVEKIIISHKKIEIKDAKHKAPTKKRKSRS